jgi:hypothetical protein
MIQADPFTIKKSFASFPRKRRAFFLERKKQGPFFTIRRVAPARLGSGMTSR